MKEFIRNGVFFFNYYYYFFNIYIYIENIENIDYHHTQVLEKGLIFKSKVTKEIE